MNFYDNIPPQVPQMNIPNINNPMMINNNIFNKINELELKIKKLEQRISLLETNNINNNYIEPDNSLYMI